jgi:hypothetical protein
MLAAAAVLEKLVIQMDLVKVEMVLQFLLQEHQLLMAAAVVVQTLVQLEQVEVAAAVLVLDQVDQVVQEQ